MGLWTALTLLVAWLAVALRDLTLIGPLTRPMSGIQAGRQRAVASTITIRELTVRPWQVDRPAVAREYEVLLVHSSHLTLAGVTRDVARQAAQLRARFCLRPAGALRVATALVQGARTFVTNDRRLVRLAPVVDIIILDDMLGNGRLRN